MRCTDEGEAYRFVVSDIGPGIDPRVHARSWVVFTTLEARDKVENTGIGLSVVKKVVEARGGQVSVESQARSGAALHVVWPKVAVEPL